MGEVEKYNKELTEVHIDYDERGAELLGEVPETHKKDFDNLQGWLWENVTDIFTSMKAKIKIIKDNV